MKLHPSRQRRAPGPLRNRHPAVASQCENLTQRNTIGGRNTFDSPRPLSGQQRQKLISVERAKWLSAREAATFSSACRKLQIFSPLLSLALAFGKSLLGRTCGVSRACNFRARFECVTFNYRLARGRAAATPTCAARQEHARSWRDGRSERPPNLAIDLARLASRPRRVVHNVAWTKQINRLLCASLQTAAGSGANWQLRRVESSRVEARRGGGLDDSTARQLASAPAQQVRLRFLSGQTNQRLKLSLSRFVSRRLASSLRV